MASVQDCERALLTLTDRFSALDAGIRSRYALERTVSWHVVDLEVVFTVRVADGEMGELKCADASAVLDDAQVRLTTDSDDLIALAGGALSPPAAWATGRLTVEAGVLDLLRLRSWL